ncbi:MAG TPA: methionyl-tRNA formyltransferase [Candidatus Binatia bacterium]|jgi:methionyl-tRNA formyltransferase|nr:methionyl-tRNA formyltransferase [Candidatus Binatia bacterium]
MRVLLVGQAAFAAKVLEGIIVGGDEVVAVVCPPDRGPKPDPVKTAAITHGIPLYQFPSLKVPEAREVFVGAAADVAVLAYVTQIVPESLLGVPPHGTICFHPSLLPKYRGGGAIPWQLIKGETKTGVTVFWTDAGIDTGPILLQREAPVGPDDTAGTLYYQTLFPLGVEVVLESIKLIRDFKAPRVPQDDAQGTYDPLLTDAHAQIDWTQPQQRVHDLIRGCDPQPGAYSTWKGAKLRCFDPRRVDGRGTPGQVLAIDADGITIATTGGAVRCARLRGDGAKAAAAEVAQALGLTTGATLGQ